MQVEIIHSPGNAAAKISLNDGETVTCEGGAMIAMSGNVEVETSTHKKGGGGGGVMGALKRMVTGESFFLNHFTPKGGQGEVWVGAALAGDLKAIELSDGKTLIVNAGGFVASEPSIDMEVGWQGFQSMFSGESLFWIKMSGQGKVVLSSFGAIYPVEIDGAYIVDTGHIVAFDDSLKFKLSKAGKSWISSILGGEGLVCRFEGKGVLWCQSHNESSFGKALGPLLKARSG